MFSPNASFRFDENMLSCTIRLPVFFVDDALCSAKLGHLLINVIQAAGDVPGIKITAQRLAGQTDTKAIAHGHGIALQRLFKGKHCTL